MLKKLLKKVPILAAILALSASTAVAGEIHLSVAASLREVINELSDNFSRKHPGAKILRNYGASGALAKQIENGAPADIFISANQEWMDYLKKRQLADQGSIAIFTHNTLVFVGGSGKKVNGMRDLVTLEKIGIGSPKSVPAGEYAMQAIKRAGLEKQLEKKLVLAKDVRDCLMYAERGEVDGAFVYRTDALQGRQAKILFTVPRNLYPEVAYPMAVTAAGVRNKEAVAFFKYLNSGEAKAVLKKYGFSL